MSFPCIITLSSYYLVISKKVIAALGAFTKVCSAKELLIIMIDLSRGREIICNGRRKSRMLRRCWVFQPFVSVPSTGSLIDLFDGSKPTMLAMDNNIAATVAINIAVTVNTIVDLRFNNQISAHYSLIKCNLCSL